MAKQFAVQKSLENCRAFGRRTGRTEAVSRSGNRGLTRSFWRLSAGAFCGIECAMRDSSHTKGRRWTFQGSSTRLPFSFFTTCSHHTSTATRNRTTWPVTRIHDTTPKRLPQCLSYYIQSPPTTLVPTEGRILMIFSVPLSTAR